jgi:hypothetical protein
VRPKRETVPALKDYFIQFYRGVNPYGQLRPQKDWWSVGFGWTFGLL